jgi:hypothetical protein
MQNFQARNGLDTVKAISWALVVAVHYAAFLVIVDSRRVTI